MSRAKGVLGERDGEPTGWRIFGRGNVGISVSVHALRRWRETPTRSGRAATT